MKRILAIAALAAAFTFSAQAQNTLGNILGGILGGGNSSNTEQKTENTTTTTNNNGSSATDVLGQAVGSVLGDILGGTSTGNATVDAAIGNVLGDLLGTVAKPRLEGTYLYSGVAVSMTTNEGGVVSNLAGTAASSAVETKVDEYLTKFGIKPGTMSITFYESDMTFVWTIGGFPFNGTFQVTPDMDAITLNFGRSMKFFTMTGNLDLTLDGVKMLFSSDKLTAFLKKALAKLGEKQTDIGQIAKLAAGYDNYKVGFKLARQK
ncbi:MAG: DUF4923 family protein [Bacteroidales bacterium]|nr:DUF4923 family protein [Bacteroidales bacterium]